MDPTTPLRPPGNDKLFRRRLIAWFRWHGRDLPWRGISDPYAILVSEFMLQQTQVATVIEYFGRWMQRFPDFESLAAADEQDVLHAWQGLGYYSRARNLQRAARAVVERHSGELPRNPDAIRALPGVGPYTAGALATFAFDLPEPAIDGNVTRVLARLFDFRESVDSLAGTRKFQEWAKALQPRLAAGQFNAALMELGALVCVARRPRCEICPVKSFCSTRDPASLPLKRPRPQTLRITDRRALILSRGRVLLEQEVSRRWRGLWVLPRANGAPTEELLVTKYTITHHQVALHVLRGKAPRKIGARQQWIPRKEVARFPMPSPHRRVLDLLLPEAR